MQIKKFNQFVFESWDDSWEGNDIEVNGVKLSVTFSANGDQPDLTLSAALRFDSAADPEFVKLVKAGVWSEKMFNDGFEDGDTYINIFGASKSVRGLSTATHYNGSEVYDMFDKRVERFMGKKYTSQQFAALLKKESDYDDFRALKQAEIEEKLGLLKEFKSKAELEDLIEAISKADLVAMARGKGKLSDGAEKAVKKYMSVHKKKSDEAVEDILNLVK